MTKLSFNVHMCKYAKVYDVHVCVKRKEDFPHSVICDCKSLHPLQHIVL